MKIKYEDIDRIINILKQAKEKLKAGEIYEFTNIKEKSKLPEFWYVERNPSNCGVINEYANRTFKRQGWVRYDRNLAVEYEYPISNNNLSSNYKKITFEDFKKYILNED